MAAQAFKRGVTISTLFREGEASTEPHSIAGRPKSVEPCASAELLGLALPSRGLVTNPVLYVLVVLCIAAWASELASSLFVTEELCKDMLFRADEAAGPSDARWLDSFSVAATEVSNGILGTHGNLGFSGRCVSIAGHRHAHSIGMYPIEFGSAFVDFTLDEEGFDDERWLHFRVGINDDNNARGKAGSALVFSVICTEWHMAHPSRQNDLTIWQSKGIRKAGEFGIGLVNIAGVKTLRLEVTVASNRGAHAVWIDPRVILSSAAGGLKAVQRTIEGMRLELPPADD